jgi:hypothetical protein
MSTYLFKIGILFYLLSSFGLSKDSPEFEKTIGMINKQFKGYSISRKATKDPCISMLMYESGPFDLDSISKANLLGVIFLIKDSGEILSIIPATYKSSLPSQKIVNFEVDSSVKTSEFFEKHDLDELNELQSYGLLSRWAIAILARDEEKSITFQLSEDQRVKINRLFKGLIEIPKNEVAPGKEKDEKIEKFAKDIIKFSPPDLSE